MNTHFFLLSLSFCSLFLLFQQQQHSLSVARFFLNRKNFFCFFFLLVFLPLSFFSSNTKTLYTRLWNKLMLKSMEYSDYPQAQIWVKV
jgi:hypothetical protein